MEAVLAVGHTLEMECARMIYHGIKHTVRDRKSKGWSGETTAHFQTATWQLAQGSRLLYKMLKKDYLANKRKST